MKIQIINLKKIAFLFLITFFIFDAKGQWYDPEKVNKKAKVIYESAYDFAMEGNYQLSIEKLNEAINKEPKYVEAYLSRAGINADLKKYELSVADFRIAFSLDSIFCESYQLPYSISLAGIGDFENALLKINSFIRIEQLNKHSIKAAAYRKSTYEFALAHSKKYPLENYRFEPKNIGPGINTTDLEYFPSLTIDGKQMIFNRRVDNDEDFYKSDFINNEWSVATPVSGHINTNLNEGAQTISQEGRWLIFTGCNYPEGLGSCDLYISYLTKNGNWSEPENLGMTVNSEFWESTPSLSPDKKDLYFSSNRTGGFGGKDIWVSHRNNQGKWSAPENLGPTINTDGDETCPFIHADNNTLYFNSNGLMGYGKSDIFLSKRNLKNWETPINLGYPINTIDDEGSLIVAADGKTSYYASDKGDVKNGIDIYTFQLRNEFCAAKTIWLNGKVFDKKTNTGLPSSVTLTDINKRINNTQIQTDEDGNFFVTLPIGNDYALNVNRKGYLFYSENFSLPLNSLDSFFNLNIALQKIEQGNNIILKNIFFKSNSSQLQPNSSEELEELIALLNENPKLKIEIAGHTDNVGKNENNKILSTERANAVVTYLITRGINKDRLSAKGFGDTMPISNNDTEKGKSLNRRTEINVVSN